MDHPRRSLSLAWVHVAIVVLVLAIPVYVVPYWVKDQKERHEELAPSATLRSILGIVEWIAANLIVTVMILGVFSLDVYLCGKLHGTRARMIHAAVVAMVATVLTVWVMIMCRMHLGG